MTVMQAVTVAIGINGVLLLVIALVADGPEDWWS